MVEYKHKNDIIEIVTPVDVEAGIPTNLGVLSSGIIPITDGKVGDLVAFYNKGVVSVPIKDADAVALDDDVFWSIADGIGSTSGDILIGLPISEKASGVVGNVDVMLYGV